MKQTSSLHSRKKQGNILFKLNRFEDTPARIKQAETLGMKINAQLKKIVLKALRR